MDCYRESDKGVFEEFSDVVAAMKGKTIFLRGRAWPVNTERKAEVLLSSMADFIMANRVRNPDISRCGAMHKAVIAAAGQIGMNI